MALTEHDLINKAKSSNYQVRVWYWSSDKTILIGKLFDGSEVHFKADGTVEKIHKLKE